jgi:hypothetical protein
MTTTVPVPTTTTGTQATESPARVSPDLPPDLRRIRALRRFALSITVFNILGHAVLGFEQAPITPIVAVLVSYAAAVLFETLDAWTTGRAAEYRGGVRSVVEFLLPAHIAGLACAMLLWGNASLWPYVFAVTVANASKYLVRVKIRGRWRHVLNPSNSGIAVTLVLFPWVGIAPPYHFTNNVGGTLDWLIPLGILMLGTMLNAKLTGKVPLILGWVGGFVAQAVIRSIVFDHSLLGALVPMTGVAFILFTNYMITDPGTTPTTTRDQVIFGLATAAIYGVLVVAGVVFGLFFALTIICLLRGAIWLAAPLKSVLLSRAPVPREAQ